MNFKLQKKSLLRRNSRDSMHSKGTITSTWLWDSYLVYNRRSMVFGPHLSQEPYHGSLQLLSGLFEWSSSFDLSDRISQPSLSHNFSPEVQSIYNYSMATRPKTIVEWRMSGHIAFLYFARTFLSPSMTCRQIRRIWARSEIRVEWICILERII